MHASPGVLIQRVRRFVQAYVVTVIALIAVFAAFAVASAGTAIDVVASNWKFTPAIVDATVGQETTLNLTSSEGVHGVESADIGLAKTMIVPGKATAVRFTPKKAGTYAVHCAVVCGAGHETMILTVKVAP